MKRALGIISVVMACSTMFAQAIIQSCQLQSAILGQSVNVCTTPGSFTFFETITANVQGGGTATTAGTGNDGVSLEVIDVTWGSGAISVSSSPANTWTPGTMQTHGAVKHQQFYCISPATDPAVATFSVTGTGDTVFHVNMFTSTGTPTFVGESGGGASSSATFQPGTTSPATAIQNGLFITGLGAVDSLVGIDSGFSTPADASLSGFSDSTSFKISGGAENPTWTCSLPNAGSVTMMLFSPGCAPSGCTPSYANTGGTGNRTAIIMVIDGPTPLLNPQSPNTDQSLVDGDTTSNGRNFFNGIPLDGVNTYIVFDFGAPALITESKYYQQLTTSQGTWKWQGSTDNSTYTDIGSTFTLGGVATQTITTMSANTTSYRYYRLLGVSGSANGGPWIYQFEFKICGL